MRPERSAYRIAGVRDQDPALYHMRTKPFYVVWTRMCGGDAWTYDYVYETRDEAEVCAGGLKILGYSSVIACIRIPVEQDTTPQIYDAGGAVDLEK